MRRISGVALGLAVAACGGPAPRPAAPIADCVNCTERRAAPRPAPPAAAPPASTRAPAPAPRRPARRYRGRRIDFDVKDADLHNVFRLLADVGGVNIVVADDVRGTVTMRLRNVPWEQVMYAVAKVKRLHLRFADGIYFVTKSEQLQREP